MATVNIGNIKLNWKGAYNGSTAYAIDDVVSYNGSSYVCIQASTGNLPTVTAYWEQMSQKGTDADLINITGTVQGDLYYNNGSAIARLAPGVANQVLQTGGTGANPSWTTMSSDVVKLASTEATGVNAVTFDSIFTSDYYQYKFVGAVLVGTDDKRYEFNPRISGANQLANCYQIANYIYRDFSDTTGVNNIDARMNTTDGGRMGWGATNTWATFEILISNPQTSSKYKIAQYKSGSIDSGYLYHRTGMVSWRQNQNAFDGMRFFIGNSSSDTADWLITAYGIKK